jgi:hypothetical protein
MSALAKTPPGQKDLNRVLTELPKMSQSQIDDYFKKAIEIAKPKK